MKRRTRRLFLFMMLTAAILQPCPEGPGLTVPAQAASVTCKSKYYVTTKISKKSLKKGKKAKVTIKVANNSGDDMKDLKLKVTLPAGLKKASGSPSKSKTVLNKNKTCSYSFYVKAKDKVQFCKTVKTSKKVSGQASTVTAKNLIKKGKKKTKKYIKVVCSFNKPAEVPQVQPESSTQTGNTEAKTETVSAQTDPVSYGDAMVDLLDKMNIYAKSQAKNKNPGFLMISNGGYNLYGKKASTKAKMLGAVDGVLIEDAFSDDDSKDMQACLQEAIKAGKKAFNIEYETGHDTESKKLGSVCYSAPSDELDEVKAYTNSKAYDVSDAAAVQSFMALFDPHNYKTRAAYLAALNNTDYDLIFIDLFYGYDSNGIQKPLTKAEVDSLKKKKNGSTRKVCAYLSVGEAEDYRYYWQAAWDKKANRPVWIDEENKEWEGNYKVKYWYPEWQNILYGSSTAYLDRILAAGFDGVYLDVIDAYEYYEDKK